MKTPSFLPTSSHLDQNQYIDHSFSEILYLVEMVFARFWVVGQNGGEGGMKWEKNPYFVAMWDVMPYNDRTRDVV